MSSICFIGGKHEFKHYNWQHQLNVIEWISYFNFRYFPQCMVLAGPESSPATKVLFHTYRRATQRLLRRNFRWNTNCRGWKWAAKNLPVESFTIQMYCLSLQILGKCLESWWLWIWHRVFKRVCTVAIDDVVMLTISVGDLVLIPGSGLPDQVSKAIYDNITSAMIPVCPATACDKVLNILTKCKRQTKRKSWMVCLKNQYFMFSSSNFSGIT